MSNIFKKVNAWRAGKPGSPIPAPLKQDDPPQKPDPTGEEAAKDIGKAPDVLSEKDIPKEAPPNDSVTKMISPLKKGTWADAVAYQKKKGGKTMNELVKERNAAKKRTDAYAKAQNAINEA